MASKKANETAVVVRVSPELASAIERYRTRVAGNWIEPPSTNAVLVALIRRGLHESTRRRG